MSDYSEIVHHTLWSGSRKSLNWLPELKRWGLKCVVSVLPIGSLPVDQSAVGIRKQLDGLNHRIVVSGDWDELPPEYIEHALSFDGPTLVHCNAGVNRSTTISACWLIKWIKMPWKEALDKVQSIRKAEVSKEMQQNVRRFADYRKMIQSSSS